MMTSDTTEGSAAPEFGSTRLTMADTPGLYLGTLSLQQFAECSIAYDDYGSPPTRVTLTMMTVRHMITMSRMNDAAAAFPISSDVNAFFQIR